MTSIPLELEKPSAPSALTRFLGAQAIIWTAYGIVLMLPWLDEYPVSIMWPNKLVIAASGLLASVALRALYQRLGRSVAVAAAASAGMGLLWSAVLTALLGRSVGAELFTLGSLSGGVPRLGGAIYEMCVLFVWSMLYLGVRPAAARATPAPPQHPAGPDLLVARDGTRALITEPGEIDWVEASGDYVRVHTNGRSVLLRGTMTSYEAGLGAEYVRIHRSAIVHVGRIREMIARPNREYLVVLRDGTKLRASRMYSQRLVDALAMSGQHYGVRRRQVSRELGSQLATDVESKLR